MPTNEFRIVRPTESDIPLILELFRELAVYEKLEESFITDADTLRKSIFGEFPAAEIRLAFAGDTPVGYMVFFQNFSTFLGRAGIYLEDLYVKPEHRGAGYGRQLLAEVARIAVERGCKRLEWLVLNWNTTAIDFYKRMSAEPMQEWTTFRLAGTALMDLANSASLP